MKGNPWRQESQPDAVPRWLPAPLPLAHGKRAQVAPDPSQPSEMLQSIAKANSSQKGNWYFPRFEGKPNGKNDPFTVNRLLQDRVVFQGIGCSKFPGEGDGHIAFCFQPFPGSTHSFQERQQERTLLCSRLKPTYAKNGSGHRQIHSSNLGLGQLPDGSAWLGRNTSPNNEQPNSPVYPSL